MVNTYEAQVSIPEASKNEESPDMTKVEENSAEIVCTLQLDEEMLALGRTVEALIPDNSSKVVMFIASREGEGTSTIAREFAEVLSRRTGKSLLLLDSDRTKASRDVFCGIRSGLGWLEAIRTFQPLDRAIYRVGDSRLFVSPCLCNGVVPSEIFRSESFDNFWHEMKRRFDFIVIDSAPIEKSNDSLAIVSRTDGVVLVLEAENTSINMAAALKNKILNAGGNILGVILNKHHQHIPRILDKCL